MNRTLCALGACLLLLCGCASRYDVTLSNGAVIRALGKPKLDEQGFYRFKDASGQEVQLNSMRVRQIEPASRRNAGTGSFLPTPM